MLDPSTPQLELWQADPSADSWTVRESRRARRLIVRVHHSGEVEVIVPRRTSRRTVTQFLDRHREWIERKQAESRHTAPRAESFPPNEIVLTATGESWRVHIASGAGRTRVIETAPGILTLAGNLSDTRLAHQALRRWLISRARETLSHLLYTTAREASLSYRKISIRRQRTRWGSCSTRGTISLNCALLFQRPEVMRYLLIHELAHTQHMNHSLRFWDCVASLCADYEKLDKELCNGWRRVPEWVFG